MARRVLALFFVAYSTWILLTWTKTAEQLLVGAVAAAAVGAACAPLGPVAAPWVVLAPTRLWAALRLAGWSSVQIVRAGRAGSRSTRAWSSPW